MSDVLALELIAKGFYLLVFVGVAGLYRKEIGGLISSIGSFKVAGASFELGDQRTTVASHMILAEILVDTLSNISSATKINELITLPQAEKLGQFAVRYTAAVPKDSWNEEMLRNIGFLLQHVGRSKQAIVLFDQLLEQRPDHYDFLDQKAFALMTMGGVKNLESAELLLTELCDRGPQGIRACLRLAVVKSMLKKFDESIQQISIAVDIGLGPDFKDALDWPHFHLVRDARSQEFAELARRAQAATATSTPNSVVTMPSLLAFPSNAI